MPVPASPQRAAAASASYPSAEAPQPLTQAEAGIADGNGDASAHRLAGAVDSTAGRLSSGSDLAIEYYNHQHRGFVSAGGGISQHAPEVQELMRDVDAVLRAEPVPGGADHRPQPPAWQPHLEDYDAQQQYSDDGDWDDVYEAASRADV